MPGLGMSPRTSQCTWGRGNVMYSIAERVNFVDMPKPPSAIGGNYVVIPGADGWWSGHNAYFGALNESI